jgi:metal iron transporter
MNCPSRTDEPEGSGMNQSPNSLAADLTTREDLNGMANSRILRRIASEIEHLADDEPGDSPNEKKRPIVKGEGVVSQISENQMAGPIDVLRGSGSGGGGRGVGKQKGSRMLQIFTNTRDVVKKFGHFIGPGMMVSGNFGSLEKETNTIQQISVAYIDPGNYSTDVAAGASYRFRLLFIVLMSNIFAIFLQSLCIKLGSVSGLNLAEACRAFLPRWLNIFLYIMAEAAVSHVPQCAWHALIVSRLLLRTFLK